MVHATWRHYTQYSEMLAEKNKSAKGAGREALLYVSAYM